MRLTILLLVLGGISVTQPAQAGRFEFGPQLGVSVPNRDAGNFMDPGVNAGVTGTYMETPSAGFGLDCGYHRWPGSSRLNSETDALFSQLSSATITGSKWTWSALQVTGHVRLAPKVKGPIAPWIKLGAGVYWVTGNLNVPADQLRAAGVQVLDQNSGDTTNRFGYVGSLGFDMKAGAHMKLGLDASYHYLLWKISQGQNFSAYTVGVHVTM